MTITFANNNDVIVYALAKIISYAQDTQQVFVAQCVWWLVSVIGLEQGLVHFIDNLQARAETAVVPEENPVVPEEPLFRGKLGGQDKIVKECEEYLKDSRRLRDLAKLKISARTETGRKNPLAST
jgi:hypothetical protein